MSTETIATADTTTSTRDDLLARIAELTAKNTTLASHVDYWTTRSSEAHRLHASDIATIGKRLNEEAQSNNWCAEYDNVLSDLNDGLNIPLPPREQVYEIGVEVRVYLRVTASGEEEARSAGNAIVQQLAREVDGHDDVASTQWESSYDYTIELES